MPTLLITDLNPSLHIALKAKAVANNRSISDEAQAILSQAIASSDRDKVTAVDEQGTPRGNGWLQSKAPANELLWDPLA